MDKKILELKKQYEQVCNQYVKLFCEKHFVDLEFWVGDEVGGIASFGCVFYFNYEDIRYDIENKIRKGAIFEWLEYTLQNQNDQNINYKNYIKSNLHKK